MIGRKTGNFLLFISNRDSTVKLKETEIFKIKTCLPLKLLETFQEILQKVND
jgi:hypothetical protein